jgi:hypothetical protein
MTNMIRKVAVAIKGGPGGAGLFIPNSFFKSGVGIGRIFVDRKGGTPQPVPTHRFNLLGTAVAAITLKGDDDGDTVAANNAAATVVVTLPKASVVGPGFRITVVTAVLPGAGAGTTVTPNAADKFQGNGFGAKTAGQTLINSAATDAVGDLVTLVSDGGTIWYVTGKVGTWA